MSIKTKLKEIEDNLSLTKKYPDYFNKKIFRTTTTLLLIIFLIGYATNDYKLINAYAECDSDQPCQNPFYLCKNIQINQTNYFTGAGYQCLQKNTWKTKNLCEQGYCDIQTLQPHQIIGNKPNYYNQHIILWILTLYLLAFTTNHIIYKKRK